MNAFTKLYLATLLLLIAAVVNYLTIQANNSLGCDYCWFQLVSLGSAFVFSAIAAYRQDYSRLIYPYLVALVGFVPALLQLFGVLGFVGRRFSCGAVYSALEPGECLQKLNLLGLSGDSLLLRLPVFSLVLLFIVTKLLNDLMREHRATLTAPAPSTAHLD